MPWRRAQRAHRSDRSACAHSSRISRRRAEVAWTRDELEDHLWKVLAREDAGTLRQRVKDSWGSRPALLDDIAENSGLIGPHEGPGARWKFYHDQFREFLAAMALRDCGNCVGLTRSATI